MLSAIAVLVAYGIMLAGLRPFPLLTEILTHYSKLLFTISAPPEIRINLFSDLNGKREKKGYVKHIHMPSISICYTYTYALHLPILNICIKAGRPGGNNENRIHF